MVFCWVVLHRAKFSIKFNCNFSLKATGVNIWSPKLSYILSKVACILRQLFQGFWMYRVSISDVNDSMNDDITVLINFLWLSIISTYTFITLLYWLFLRMNIRTQLSSAKIESSLICLCCFININTTKFLIAWINAITSSDHKLNCDSTANYGHSLFLWNICVGGL